MESLRHVDVLHWFDSVGALAPAGGSISQKGMVVGSVDLNAVVFEQDGLWVAQCLEHDISARAPTLTQLPAKFARAIAANICANEDYGRVGLQGFPPAPPHFHKLFGSAAMQLRPLDRPTAPHPFRINDLRYAEIDTVVS